MRAYNQAKWLALIMIREQLIDGSSAQVRPKQLMLAGRHDVGVFEILKRKTRARPDVRLACENHPISKIRKILRQRAHAVVHEAVVRVRAVAKGIEPGVDGGA